MSKKLLYILLIPALLLIAGYLALQVYLRTGDPAPSAGEPEQLVTTQGSAAESSQSVPPATADAVAEKNEEPEAKKDSAKSVDASPEKDSAEAKKASPLDLRPLFINKLQQLVKKSSDGLYDLSVGELDLDVLASTVSLHNVVLRPDEQVVRQMKADGRLPQSVVSLSFEGLLIEGINIDDAINSKSMDYKLIKLVKPTVEIDRYSSGSNSGGGGDFSQGFLKEMQKLAIDKLQVENGTVVVKDKGSGSTKKLQNVQVQMQDILLNETTRNDSSRFLFAKDAQLEFHDFGMETKDGLYAFKIGDAFVDATGKKVKLKNVSYGSPLSKEAFVAKQVNATEKYDVSLPELTISGVDWWTALNGKAVRAGEVETTGGQLAVFFDRSLPPKNKTGSFPNQLLAKLPVEVDVEKIKMQQLDVSYEEYNPTSKQSGTLSLEDITMTITNISNKEDKGKPMIVEGSALLLQQVPLTATFTFSREEAKRGAFSARLHLDSFSAKVINPVAKPLGLMQAERGRVHSIDVQMQGDEKAASGEVLVLYDKLRIAILKKKAQEEELKKRHLLSFFANWFVIKNDNPWWLTGKKRRKEAYFERNTEAGFLNLVWKTALVGLLKTMGAPEKMAKKK